ncbi:MAG TPA: hypothetical protein VMW89_04140 [Desulfatiglandales bacterium]|nr:hypothetical protein [Desulfatiglandales bacterium]
MAGTFLGVSVSKTWRLNRRFAHSRIVLYRGVPKEEEKDQNGQAALWSSIQRRLGVEIPM